MYIKTKFSDRHAHTKPLTSVFKFEVKPLYRKKRKKKEEKRRIIGMCFGERVTSRCMTLLKANSYINWVGLTNS